MSFASAGATGSSLMTAGRRAARAYRCRRARRLCRLHAPVRLLDRGGLCRRQCCARHRDLGGRHRHAAAVVVAATVAGDGIGHPRILCALRSRPDPDLADLGAQSIRGAHGPHCRRGRHHCRAAGGAVHRRAGATRRRPLARRLWRGRRDGRGGDGGGAGADDPVVSSGRRAAYPADRADRGGGDRRRVRHWAASCRDFLLRQHFTFRRAAIRLDAGARARPRQRLLVAGARRTRRSRARS